MHNMQYRDQIKNLDNQITDHRSPCIGIHLFSWSGQVLNRTALYMYTVDTVSSSTCIPSAHCSCFTISTLCPIFRALQCHMLCMDAYIHQVHLLSLISSFSMIGCQVFFTSLVKPVLEYIHARPGILDTGHHSDRLEPVQECYNFFTHPIYILVYRSHNTDTIDNRIGQLCERLGVVYQDPLCRLPLPTP